MIRGISTYRRGRRAGDDETAAVPAQSGLSRALALTLASAFIWGVAHLAVGRRLTGGLLMAVFTLIATSTATTVYRPDLLALAVRPEWAVRPDRLVGIAVGLLALGLIWAGVVIRSYRLVRPAIASTGARLAGHAVVGLLSVALIAPPAWAAHYTYVYRDTLISIFQPTAGGGWHRMVNPKDPWAGRRRVNILLLGGDAAHNRSGVRTDSITLASIDTRTGATILLSLPRNLENAPMPPGPARQRFPYGFSGDGPLNPGLLNEVYEYAANHPDVVPGVAKEHRGGELLKATVAQILGQRVDYYVLVNMFGFADIINAMGGVRIKIEHPIPYGQHGRVLAPGDRMLNGKEALWYGRSRNDSDDYARMSRQKCLLRAVVKQANPQRVLIRFERLATATKRTISTDIPQELLPALVKLSGKVKGGARIDSLQFVPPLIHTGHPDFALIRSLSAKAIADSERPVRRSSRVRAVRTPNTAHATPMSLDAACPS